MSEFKQTTNRYPIKLYAEIVKRSEKESKSINEVINSLLEKELFNEYNILDLDSPYHCDNLAFADDTFWCVSSREGNTPNKRKLAKDIEGVREICRACKRDAKRKEEKEMLNKINIEQKEEYDKLMNEERILEIPYCLEGGVLQPDLKHFYCRRINDEVSIDKHCKTINKGGHCKSLRFTKIPMQINELKDKKKIEIWR